MIVSLRDFKKAINSKKSWAAYDLEQYNKSRELLYNKIIEDYITTSQHSYFINANSWTASRYSGMYSASTGTTASYNNYLW